MARTKRVGGAHVSCAQGMEMVPEPIPEGKDGHHRGLASTLRIQLLADDASSYSGANTDSAS